MATNQAARATPAALLATLLAVATIGILGPGSVMGAERDFRGSDVRLKYVCRNGLSFTAEPVPQLPARSPRDERGVPMIIVDGERHYRPGALAINGMKRIDAYRATRDPAQLDQALRQAERLRLMSMRRRGASWVPFLYDYLSESQRAPWFNAMVQGVVLSFYVRLYRVTHDHVHLEAAHGIFRSFLRLGQKRPTWVAYVDAAGYLWLEHYPLRNPDHVLNAHLHAIFGIYEYWQLTRSPEARRVLRGAITTMRAHGQRYRRPGTFSLYGLRHRTSKRKYHEIHIWQLRLLAKMSGERWFDHLARQLSQDIKPEGHVPGRPALQGLRALSQGCRPGKGH